VVIRATRLFLSSAVAVVALTVAAVATLAVTTTPGAAQPVVAGNASPAKNGSPRCTIAPHVPKGQIVVPVVVDFGGRNGRVLVTCILVKRGVSGAQVLQAQAALLGYPTPRYAESGLLCAIDGYPTSGCGTQSGDHYAYWAYWHGGRRWQYANGGPGEWKVARGDVEGWRFEPDGSATPADPPPRDAPGAAALEVPAGTVAATTTSSSPSGNHAAGPVEGGRKGTGPVPFVVSVAFILLIGAGAMVRSRRANGRAN
jgi:hypothetical protein